MITRTVGELIEALTSIPAGSFTHESVLAEIGHSVIDPDSLRPYLFFSPLHYTRNLIHRCELFEVLAIGWEPGQVSAVHNHRGQECWMGAPIGSLEVVNYKLIEKDPVQGTCRVEPSYSFWLDPTHPAAVDLAEPIHLVRNPAQGRRRALSLHVYSRPFDSCEVYLPDKGLYFDVPLDYTSRNGVLCPGEIAEMVAV